MECKPRHHDFQAWVGNIPNGMTSQEVTSHIGRQTGILPLHGYVQANDTGKTQWGIVTFKTMVEAERFREAGAQPWPFFWPGGMNAVVRKAHDRSPGGKIAVGKEYVELLEAVKHLSRLVDTHGLWIGHLCGSNQGATVPLTRLGFGVMGPADRSGMS